MTSYFFETPTPDQELITGNKQLKKLSPDEITSLLTQAKAALETADFTPEAIQDSLNQLLETTGQKPGILFSLIRIAVSWAPFSPALNDTLATLGKEEVRQRLQTAIDQLPNL
jgi:glutamyl/glutaminyl-tRNA synthetase